MKYIDKNALVAELNRLIAELVEEGENTMFEQGRISALEDIKYFINYTLEVKDVGNSNDVFIEKACKYFRTKKKCVFACIGEDVYQSLLNKEEIEDFKNYMKGE